MQHPIEVPEAPFAVHGHRRNGVVRLSLVGTLDRRTVSKLEIWLDDIAHAGGASVLDLHRILLPPLPGERTRMTRLRIVEDVP